MYPAVPMWNPRLAIEAWDGLRAALPSSKLVKGATVKVYPGLPHGMCSTNEEQINRDLLAFLQQRSEEAAA
jgi:hypothetical protein